MKRMSFFLIIFLCVIVTYYTPINAGEKLWVSSQNARLKADKSSSSKTLIDLSVGEELTVISLANKWYQVSTSQGIKGWIYRGKVSDTPPDAELNYEEEALFDEIVLSSIEADTASTSRSIRGRRKKGAEGSEKEKTGTLLPQAKKYAHRTKIPKDYQTVLVKALALQPDSGEIELFFKKGKIGEYAE
ncbi:MAG: SH3 domain-containing protein [bacterium]